MKNLYTSRAFTLVESMIAITILTLAVTGALYTAKSALVAANIARDQLIASYLAQEGIEYMRLVRDNAYLDAYRVGGADVSTTAWGTFSASIAQCRDYECTLDPTRGGSSLQTGSSPLYRMGNGVYTIEHTGTLTSFTRTLQVFDVSATEVSVVSKVVWNYKGTPYSVTINDHFTPWQ